MRNNYYPKKSPAEKKVLILRSMKVVIDERAGVCAGVKRAIRLVEDKLSQENKTVALGPLIHNKVEVDRLARKGLETIDQNALCQGDFDLKSFEGKQLVIRTHGISVKLRNKLLTVDVIDGTCPRVRRVQQLIEKYFTDDYQIVIVGKKDHPEVKGLEGYSQNTAFVVSSHRDVARIDFNRKTLLISQTTASPDLFRSIHKKLKSKISDLVVQDTTCKLINRRHEHLQNFSATNDVVIFVGGKQSSNSRVLSEVCRSINKRTFLIEDASDINNDWFNDSDKVGITGGASTPKWQLYKIKDYLEKNAFHRY